MIETWMRGGGSKKKKEKPHHEALKPFLNRLKSWLRDRPFGFFYMASWKRFTEARQARLNKKTVRQPPGVLVNLQATSEWTTRACPSSLGPCRKSDNGWSCLPTRRALRCTYTSFSLEIFLTNEKLTCVKFSDTHATIRSDTRKWQLV